MKSNVNREETESKKKYVFFSDPDVIVRRAESTAAASQALQNLQILERQRRAESKVSQSEAESSVNPQVNKSELKGFETLLSYHPVQPYPFTFITAVKRKLALNVQDEGCKRVYEPDSLEKSQIDLDLNKTSSDIRRGINQAGQKMDFIKPLKVPDLKISPKTIDYSVQQAANSLGGKKFDVHTIEDNVPLTGNKSQKSAEKIHRKLDFSLLEGSSIKNCENIEPLKAPDLSIGSSLSKKKEHARDSSREKENRSKRIKKDDSAFPRKDDTLKETPRRFKSSKHLSRKDVVDEESDSILELLKPENFLSSAPRESDFGLKKQKSKNFLTSTVKKNDDKRQRSVGMQSVRSVRERSSESKNRNYDNEPSIEKSTKLYDRITTRDNFRGKGNENFENLHKVSNQDFNNPRLCDDHKYKNTESASWKQQKHCTKSTPQTKQLDNYSKSQMRQSYDKQKLPSHSEAEEKDSDTGSDISEEIKTGSGSMGSSKGAGNVCRIETINKTDDSLRIDGSLQQSKSDEASNETDNSGRNSQCSGPTDKYRENIGDKSRGENLSSQANNSDSKMIEGSASQGESNSVSPQNKSNTDYKTSQSKSLSGILLDPTRISFRDESSKEQNEFCDLVTPEINLLPRSKRRKNFLQDIENETDIRSPKHKPAGNVQTKDEGIQLLHPTALHMQFQAELHLLDSFNESLRQVMDVENCLCSAAKHEQEQEVMLKQKENETRRKNFMLTQTGRDTVDIERHQGIQSKSGVQQETIIKKNDPANCHPNEEPGPNNDAMNTAKENSSAEARRVLDAQKSQEAAGELDNSSKKNYNTPVRVTEVQTQTANDIATQTETPRVRRRHNSLGRQIPGITYERGSPVIEEIPQLSLESFNQFEDFDQIENVSLPSKMHTMSEISLHETTSSIRTETGTEISISTRDVTCSFNKYLDSELAQLIKDEKQRYDEIEMLFKSREKTLNDRTKKLVKLEEQKRALRDMGQDSRISSVKKKQRALLLKLQQEKDEMNRLKELHKKASQERKLMLQKQRNMLNPQMSTKNILTKLKRSADSQSPRRLSGPMKGYDIRSPSSMSSLVDSDKSQVDRSHIEMKTQIPDVRLHKSEGRTPRSDIIASIQEGHDMKYLKGDQFDILTEQSDASLIDANTLSPESQKFIAKQHKIQNNAAQKFDAKSKYEAKTCKYKEVMPKMDNETNMSGKKFVKQDVAAVSDKCKSKEAQQQRPVSEILDKSVCDNARSESDTLVDEYSKKSKSSQATEIDFEHFKMKREKEALLQKNLLAGDNMNTESDSIPEELSSKKSKSSQVVEDMSEMTSRSSKKNQNSSTISKENSKKSQGSSKAKSSNSKRKGSRSLKSKTSSDILTENILRSKSSSQISEEIMKHHGKRSKLEKDDPQSDENSRDSAVDEFDPNESQSSLHALVKHSRAVKEKNYQLLRNMANEHEAKENSSRKDLDNLRNVSRRQDANLQNVGNMSTRSQVSTLTISHHSSGESEKSYSRSVVIRAQDHHFRTTKKLEQILSAREAALASRRSCVEEWIAWHSRLRAEENRVARMEEAAFKLVSAASNALSYHDTTVSSDTSDVESRIEILAKKLAERRTEMARLKREAKRQAKQRLKALETNLLNQIKKYDTTIHEMREKLENKRGALLNDGETSDKLAIESKTLTDFKIPEIPIKRIKEIYKNSDLLKSRSESELRNLMSEDNERKDFNAVYRDENSENDNASYRKSSRSVASDATERSEASNSSRKLTTRDHDDDQSVHKNVKAATVSKVADSRYGNLESQSISEEIKSTNYTSNARSLSDKSEDEISTVSLKSKSDTDRNLTEDSGANEIRSEISSPLNKEETGNAEQRNTLVSESNLVYQKEIESGGSRTSLSRESESISEDIQRLNSSQEFDYESVGSNAPEGIKLSINLTSEVLSEFEERDNDSVTKYESSIRAIIDNAKSNASFASDNKSAREKDEEEISKIETHEASSTPRKVSSKTETGPSEVSPVRESISRFDGESEVKKTSTDNEESAREGSSIVENKISGEKFSKNSESISNKLSFLELGNKNLNDDISTLENDLKILSEMMSQFSKRSDGKLKNDIEKSESDDKTLNLVGNYSEKGTSDDITDLECHNDFDDDKETALNATGNATYIVDEDKEDSVTSRKDLTAQVTEIMSKIMPENKKSFPSELSQSIDEEIDFKARSRELLNEIEKSIISEHAKSPHDNAGDKIIDKSLSCIENKNERVVDELNSLENDIISIAEIISNASEAKKDIRLIRKLGREVLFEDENPEVEESLSVIRRASEFEEAEIEVNEFKEKEERTVFVPALNLSDESNDNENSRRSSDEFEKSIHSAIVHSEELSSQRLAKNSFEPSSANLERQDMTFETIKDPEYEDISEESLEVSEIMDRSESQRSERQASQKSNRLPEKYQMTQKSEDVLRILDEITQKSNEAMQRSQQFTFTPNNNSRKIDELLQRSEKLSQNFQALSKKPASQSDPEFNPSINIPQNFNSERSSPRTELPHQRTEQSSNEFFTIQTNDTIIDQPKESDKQKIGNDVRIPALSEVENNADFTAQRESPKPKYQQKDKGEDSNLEALTKLVKKLDESSEKSDNSLSQMITGIQRSGLVEESRILSEKIIPESHPSDGTVRAYDDERKFGDRKVRDDEPESSLLVTKLSETDGALVFEENINRTELKDSSTKEESAEERRVREEFGDEVSRAYEDSHEISGDGREYSEGISQDESKILTELSVNREADEASKENLSESEAGKDIGVDDKVLPKSGDKIERFDKNSFHVVAAVQEIVINTSSDVNLAEEIVDVASLPDERTVDERSGISVNPGNVVLEDNRESLERIGDSIEVFKDDLEKIDGSSLSPTELCRLFDKPEDQDEQLQKSSQSAEKSDCVSQKSDESQVSEKSDDILHKYEVELPSESSEEIDTPRSVSEIEMDSPRDPNDSRLDIEGLDDDLLGNDNNFATQNAGLRNEFHPATAPPTSEKDIEAMIDKLKVSLEQPGLDVAELEAKLLRIQQLQIELEIKKLEAEEVSYYVREIPNKPPPPYTPPSGGRLSVSQASSSPAPAVVPTNVEDLTSFTERATNFIYQAKTSGDDIIALEPPKDICELSKYSNDTSKRDRKIYNTFLFDLCKETISEVYQSEYEKPGPSWLKPNAKTKPTMKIPKTVEGLNDYVSKEVATLFGFKTKLQRENLVMRWSRKRRDRVDELLAREAQAEEDEWTKFHHDELAVKNELTTAILDSLLLDAANVVKMAYIKKRKVMS